MARPWYTDVDLPQLSVNKLEHTGWIVPAGTYGLVEAAGPCIAHEAGMKPEEGLKALERLGAPDEFSRSEDFQGRRLVRVNHGYLVLNYMHYRETRDEDVKRQYMRDYMAKRRSGEPEYGRKPQKNNGLDTTDGNLLVKKVVKKAGEPISQSADEDLRRDEEVKCSRDHHYPGDPTSKHERQFKEDNSLDTTDDGKIMLTSGKPMLAKVGAVSPRLAQAEAEAEGATPPPRARDAHASPPIPKEISQSHSLILGSRKISQTARNFRSPSRKKIPEEQIFPLTEDMRAFLDDTAPGTDHTLAWQHFRDYHLAKGDRCADWTASWRTWCRNIAKFAKQGNGKVPAGMSRHAQAFEWMIAPIREHYRQKQKRQSQ